MVGSRSCGAVQTSLMYVLYICALIHIHSLLSTGQILASATSVSIGNGPTGCPYTATKAFIGRQSAFIAHTMAPILGASSRTWPSTSAIDDALSRQVNGIPDARLGSPLKSSDFLFTEQMERMRLHSKRLYDSKLYSTTMEPPTETSEKETAKAAEEEGGGKKSKKKKSKKKEKRSATPLEV